MRHAGAIGVLTRLFAAADEAGAVVLDGTTGGYSDLWPDLLHDHDAVDLAAMSAASVLAQRSAQLVADTARYERTARARVPEDDPMASSLSEAVRETTELERSSSDIACTLLGATEAIAAELAELFSLVEKLADPIVGGVRICDIDDVIDAARVEDYDGDCRAFLREHYIPHVEHVHSHLAMQRELTGLAVRRELGRLVAALGAYETTSPLHSVEAPQPVMSEDPGKGGSQPLVSDLQEFGDFQELPTRQEKQAESNIPVEVRAEAPLPSGEGQAHALTNRTVDFGSRRRR
ncbi:hypothetical protein GCM10011410_16850 [Hoyosella rhizosphaerae]|uniref:Uncharacterized protein n=1 Tax=Hoyosella rhizosphaerae TaxID=1755582 RepID=A0A916XEQ2_9ACTN|nr:hypothetical protein GCM10011410_16850 [Hoyosella rhizosphaerae]